MKKTIAILAILTLLNLPALRGKAVNDNYTENNTYSPQGGSLSNNLSADGNSANNNGSISSSSSAFANKLDSSITGVQRFDTSNNQLGNSTSTSSLGNISNNSAGGAGGAGGYSTSNSGGNSLNNSLSNTLSSSSGGNNLSNGQGQSSSNSNTASGNNTTTNTNISESNVTKFPQQAPPLINTQITPVNNNGFNGGFTTPFGGAVVGVTRVDGSAKALNFAQAGLINEQKTDQLIKNTDKACDLVSEEECKQLKALMLRKMGVAKKK
jgi:hypothetical protein